VDDETRSGILAGRVVAHEILPDRGNQLVAIDHVEPYAARFDFRVDDGDQFVEFTPLRAGVPLSAPCSLPAPP
jgi:hypothetical protein